jgi:hypothetical protein
MLIPSMLAGHEGTAVVPTPGHAIPFSLSWYAQPAIRPAVQRFIESSLAAEPPEGWLPPPRSTILSVGATEPGNLRCP